MDEVEWDLYEQPSGRLIPVVAKVTIDDVELTLAVESPSGAVWLTEEREGVQHHYSVGQSSVCVRRIGLTWILVGSLAKWPSARTVHLELDSRLEAFFESDVGWLAVAPPDSGTATGKLRWKDASGCVQATLELPALWEMLDTGPTWYGPQYP